MMKVALSNLGTVVQEVLGKVPATPKAAIIALVGDLGAGKTTFVQALARELGVTDVVQSPTYVLMKSYPISYKQFTTLVHIDAYRLERAEEFVALKPEVFLSDPKTLVCIEWPERVEGALPRPDVTVTFSADGAAAGERYIEVV